ncbi:putative BTB/POZ domain-containing protein At2g40440 [Brassica napus]|nr:putative BTB/POZ domain-containing protein At2g40440 [Brassica napus]
MTTQTNLEVFVHGLVKVFKEQWGVDVWLKPGHNNDGDELIAAHKIILAARSKVFATMFESDKIKNWTVHETITLSDLKRKELEVFVEFCYAGDCNAFREAEETCNVPDMTTQTNLEVFVHGLVKVFKEQWGVDVWLKPGHNNDGDELIAAHKIILAARSKVFATMFESDKIKNWTVHETITLSDLKRKELEVFVEFCYAGECMPSEKLKKHAMSRYCAADKYEIPYLRDLCRNHIMSSINASNAVEILELSRLPFDKTPRRIC